MLLQQSVTLPGQRLPRCKRRLEPRRLLLVRGFLLRHLLGKPVALPLQHTALLLEHAHLRGGRPKLQLDRVLLRAKDIALLFKLPNRWHEL